MRKTIFLSGLLIALAFVPHNAHAAQAHPAGTLVNINSTIWLIGDSGTSRQAIDSVEKFYSHRLSFSRVVPANNADLALTNAGFLPWGDGVLFSDSGVTYQVSGGTKHGFISQEVFLGLGFSFDKAIPGDLSKLTSGTPIRSAQERHLPGTLLINANKAIWKQEATGASPFPSAAVFLSYGANFNETVPMNTNDANLGGQPINYRTGTLINDNGTVWVAQSPFKIGFPNLKCLLDFGFTFGMVINGDSSSLTAQGTTCADPSPQPTPGPASSYSVQTVNTSAGNFTARAAIFNLASGKVRVITDTAADRDCTNNCPVAGLNTYTSVNKAQSGMNGTYFCPADYPDCASQLNSFFWKVIDTGINKIINQNNGLGELDPVIVFDGLGSAKYFSTWNNYRASNFSAAAGINSPAVLENNSIILNHSKLDDKQKNTRSTRGILGLNGQTLYLIHVLNATVPETAEVVKAMGLEHAILLDGGGSSAMIYQGAYKTGPGRNIPNAVLVNELP